MNLGCTKCKLHLTRTQIVPGVGPVPAPLMLVGEAPGEQEDLQGVPFVGAAGQLLTKLLSRAGLSREQVYIANLLKCRPPGNRDPEPDEILACKPYLLEQIEQVNPRVIVTLGRYATSQLCGQWGDMGSLLKAGNLRYAERIPLIPLYHPAYLLRRAQGDRPAAKALFQATVDAFAKAATAAR